MPRPKDWTVDVYRINEKPPEEKERAKPVHEATASFKLPRDLSVDAAKREATARLKKKGRKLRSMSFAAPLESKRIIAHVIGG